MKENDWKGKQMEKGLVSIIIPVYNVERYLERCIQSVLCQTYRNIEVLLINDGSRDSSGDLCDRLARQDERIRVIHQKNSGQAAARNSGLDAAAGEWICFVDSDDYIKENFVEYLLELISNSEVKMGFCKVVHKDFLNRKEETEELENILKYERKQTVKYILEGRRGFTVSVWRGIYHRTLFQEIRFMPGRLYEDLEILVRLGLAADGCVMGNKRNYCYCYREDNSSNTPIKKKIQDFFAVMDSLYAIVEDGNEWLLDSVYTRDMMNCLFILANKKESADKCKAELEILRKRILTMPKGYESQSLLYKMYYQSLRFGIIPFDIACKILSFIRACVIKIGL